MSSWERQCCVLSEVDICSAYRFAFLAHQCFSWNPYLWTYGLPFPQSWYFTQHRLWLMNSFHRKSSLSVSPCSWFHQSFHVYYHAQIAGLINTSYDQVTSYRNECYSSDTINTHFPFWCEYLFILTTLCIYFFHCLISLPSKPC